MTDDQITDAIAAEIVQRVRERHPHVSHPFMRRLVRLYTLQATGQAPAPGRITNAELSRHFGIDPQRLSEDFHRALARAYRAYQERYPEDGY